MNTLIHADIFFFVSTIGFIILFVLGMVALVYVLGILRQVKKISGKIGESVEGLSAEAREFVVDLRSSRLYRMLFGRRHN